MITDQNQTQTPRKIRLSASSISAFLSCSQRWKFGSIDRLPSIDSMYAVYGSAIHSALALLYQSKKDGTLTTEELVTRKFEDEYRNRVPFAAIPEFDQPDRLVEPGKRMLQKYFREFAPMIQPRLVEEKIEIEDNSFGDDVTVVSKIDLVDDRGRIRDHKTSAKMPERPLSEANEFQLLWYAYTIHIKYAKWPSELYYDYLVKNSRTTAVISIPVELTDEKIERMLMIAKVVADQMRNGQVVANPHHPYCAPPQGGFGCDYWQSCHRVWRLRK